MKFRANALLLLTTLCWVGVCHGAAAAMEDALRQFVEGLDAGAPPEVASRRLQDPDGLSALYRNRNHRPLWTGAAPLADQLSELLLALEHSGDHGLQPENYHAETLRQLQAATTSAEQLALELLASDAFLIQARHRTSGAVSPRALYEDWHLTPPEVDAAAVLDQTAGSRASVLDTLASLWPQSAEYRRLVEERARILSLHEEEPVRVPAGPLIRPGERSERVRLLKVRLLGPNDHTDLYDDTLREAVLAFQQAAGLEIDGIIGPGTLEVLNATRFSWIDRIDANLERWRWLPREPADTHIRVNIPAFTLRVIEDGHTALSMNVIVGRPYRRTPVFVESIRYLVVNPYWNVPFKLAVQDKLPQLRADAARLKAQGFEVRAGGSGPFVAVDTVDWTGVTRSNFSYLLRQRPGEFNALGRIKFMMPNPHAVYLHDTPSRELFSKQERGFSSGCIRLAQPAALAEWLLKRDGQTDQAEKLEALMASGETTSLHLRRPLPVYLVYFTAFTDDSNAVVFRRDIYQRDAPIVAALREQAAPNLDAAAGLFHGAHFTAPAQPGGRPP